MISVLPLLLLVIPVENPQLAIIVVADDPVSIQRVDEKYGIMVVRSAGLLFEK